MVPDIVYAFCVHREDAREQDGPADPPGGGRSRSGVRGLPDQNGSCCGDGLLGGALGSTERHDMAPQSGVGGEDPVIAVTMDARGRDELREGLEEFERREQQLSAAVHVGFREAVEEAALG
jgi:hypothetical protein